MKIRYDQETDSLTIVLKQDTLVEESDETKAGVVLDYDYTGELVSIEILNASERVPEVTTLEYQLTPQRPQQQTGS